MLLNVWLSLTEVRQPVSQDEQQAIHQAEQGHDSFKAPVHLGCFLAGDQTPEDQSADASSDRCAGSEVQEQGCWKYQQRHNGDTIHSTDSEDHQKGRKDRENDGESRGALAEKDAQQWFSYCESNLSMDACVAVSLRSCRVDVAKGAYERLQVLLTAAHMGAGSQAAWIGEVADPDALIAQSFHHLGRFE